MADPISLLEQIVCCRHILWIVVLDHFQGGILSVFGCLAFIYSIGNLYIKIVQLVIPENKIAFQLSNAANAHRIVAASGVNINHILKGRSIVDPIICVYR